MRKMIRFDLSFMLSRDYSGLIMDKNEIAVTTYSIDPQVPNLIKIIRVSDMEPANGQTDLI